MRTRSRARTLGRSSPSPPPRAMFSISKSSALGTLSLFSPFPRLIPTPEPALSPRNRAAAKAGKKVLHLDAAEGYGGEWGALPEAGEAGWRVPRQDPAADEATPPPSRSHCEGEITLPARGHPVYASVYAGATTLAPGRGDDADDARVANALGPRRAYAVVGLSLAGGLVTWTSLVAQMVF
jgi:hypothetical protein